MSREKCIVKKLGPSQKRLKTTAVYHTGLSCEFSVSRYPFCTALHPKFDDMQVQSKRRNAEICRVHCKEGNFNLSYIEGLNYGIDHEGQRLGICGKASSFLTDFLKYRSLNRAESMKILCLSVLKLKRHFSKGLEEVK